MPRAHEIFLGFFLGCCSSLRFAGFWIRCTFFPISGTVRCFGPWWLAWAWAGRGGMWIFRSGRRRLRGGARRIGVCRAGMTCAGRRGGVRSVGGGG